jgi:hypothetical protein
MRRLRRKSIAVQDVWIGLILGGKCQLSRRIDRDLVGTRTVLGQTPPVAQKQRGGAHNKSK